VAGPKTLGLSSELHAYLLEHGTPPDAVQLELIEETLGTGAVARMQIAPEQGAFMTMLVQLIGARRVVEIGTFTGYSSICLARGLAEGGRLICCDVSEEWTSLARRFWEKAGVADRIDLHIAPAIETLRALPSDPPVDLSFIDADKTSYLDYYEALVSLTRPGGLILVDNVLWGGSVVDSSANDESVLAIRRFNAHVAADERVDCVMLPISDGLTLLRVR